MMLRSPSQVLLLCEHIADDKEVTDSRIKAVAALGTLALKCLEMIAGEKAARAATKSMEDGGSYRMGATA